MEYCDSVYAYYAGRDNRVFLVCLDIVKRQVSSFGDLRPRVDREDLFGVGVTCLMQLVKERGEDFLAENMPLIKDGVRTSLIEYLRKELGRKNVHWRTTDDPLKKRVHRSPKYIHQRRSVSLEDCNELADARPSSDTLYSILEQERRDVIQNALEHLRPMDREFARLYYFECVNEHEIAEKFGTTPSTVCKHLAVAREKMEHHLKHYYFCESRR